MTAMEMNRAVFSKWLSEKNMYHLKLKRLMDRSIRTPSQVAVSPAMRVRGANVLVKEAGTSAVNLSSWNAPKVASEMYREMRAIETREMWEALVPLIEKGMAGEPPPLIDWRSDIPDDDLKWAHEVYDKAIGELPNHLDLCDPYSFMVRCIAAARVQGRSE